ncbi:hypothetical protein Tco_1108285 [Tanacetum coccineum]
MAKSSSHNPSSPEITPKKEPVTLDKPKSTNPFLLAYQVEFIFEEIASTTNNEVAHLYPSHPNLKYFRETLEDSKIWVSTPTGGIRGYIVGRLKAKGTLKKSCLPPKWRLLIGQVIQCLGGKTGGLDQISNKDATILYCLANGVKVDYVRLIWEDIIHKMSKKNREKVVQYPRFLSLLLEYIMPEYDNEELTINPTQAICNFDVPVDSKAPKPSSQTKEVPQRKKPRAKSGLRRKQSLKHTSESKTEASKSKTGQLEKETRSCSAKDKSPSHLSPSTPVVSEMHKEAHRAVGGPTSLGATSKEGAHPQLSSDSTAEVDPGLSAPNDSIPSQQDQTKSIRDRLKTAQTDSGTNEESRADEVSNKIKLDDLSDLFEKEEEVAKDKESHASSHDVQLLQSHNDELKQQKAKVEAEVASLKARLSYPDINQLTNLLVTSLKPELSKLLASHNFASCLPTNLKKLPLKFTELSGEIKELKQHVKDMEIELPGDLKEIPTKLETFTSTISSLTS